LEWPQTILLPSFVNMHHMRWINVWKSMMWLFMRSAFLFLIFFLSVTLIFLVGYVLFIFFLMWSTIFLVWAVLAFLFFGVVKLSKLWSNFELHLQVFNGWPWFWWMDFFFPWSIPFFHYFFFLCFFCPISIVSFLFSTEWIFFCTKAEAKTKQKKNFSTSTLIHDCYCAHRLTALKLCYMLRTVVYLLVEKKKW